MSMLKNAALTGLVMGAVAVVVIFLANPFEGGTPNPTGSFAPVAPLLENPDPAFTVGRGIGAIDAPVVLEVWADFQCPICGQWANNIEPRLYERYVVDGKLRIEHHHYAFLGEESFTSAVGVVCAEKQDKYWAFSSWVYANQHGENEGGFSDERLRIIAAAAGLDLAAYDTCIADPANRAEVEADAAAAAALGVNSTPTLKIGDWMEPGLPTIDAISAKIDAALGKK
jgi:protein-disulfide isomerase